MPKLIEMTGKTFGRLTVVGLGGSQDTTPLWKCLCECGKTVQVAGSALRMGRQISCGCLKKERAQLQFKTHGLSGTSEASIWNAMKQRCKNKKSDSFKNYGARGISVCDRWLSSYVNFLQDMGQRPSAYHSVERRNNLIGYEPSNCYWATTKEQNSNTRRNVYVMDGDQKVTVMEWAKRHGVNPQTVYGRLRRGQPFDQPGRPGPRLRHPVQA